MKALTAIHLADGETVRVAVPIEEVGALWAQMARSALGSAYGLTRITDHGSQKRVVILPGTIVRLSEL